MECQIIFKFSLKKSLLLILHFNVCKNDEMKDSCLIRRLLLQIKRSGPFSRSLSHVYIFVQCRIFSSLILLRNHRPRHIVASILNVLCLQTNFLNRTLMIKCQIQILLLNTLLFHSFPTRGQLLTVYILQMERCNQGGHCSL